MSSRAQHLSDEQLLLFAELELPRGEAAKARSHINLCSSCSLRMRGLEATLAEAITAHAAHVRNVPTQTSQARARLQHRLRDEISAAGNPAPMPPRSMSFRMFAGAALSIACIVVAAWIVSSRYDTAAGFHTYAVEDLPLPSRALTPGSLRTVSKEDVCRDANLENDPPVNSSTRDAIFSRYAVPAASRSSYAMDYLVAPSLGGADNANNIWPEPASSAWNAADKDRLEDHLHTLVCGGQLPLVVAQNELATDWIAAYKKYFHTDKPGSMETA